MLDASVKPETTGYSRSFDHRPYLFGCYHLNLTKTRILVALEKVNNSATTGFRPLIMNRVPIRTLGPMHTSVDWIRAQTPERWKVPFRGTALGICMAAWACQPLEIVRVDAIIVSVQPSSAVIGSVVTITGTNFSSTKDLNQVTFGDVSATVLESTETMIKARVPDGIEGTVDLMVKVQGAPASVSFAVLPSFVEELVVPVALGLGDNSNSGFAVGTDIYYGGGFTFQNPIYLYSSKMGKFNTLTGSWSQAIDLPSARAGYLGFTVGSKGYILGGSYAAATPGAPTITLKDLWEFNAAGPSWTPRANYPGTQISGCGVLVIGNDVYFVAGVQDAGIVKTVYRYSTLTNTWTQLPDFPGERRIYPWAFVINGKGYIGGGIDFNNDLPYNNHYEFDPQGGTWTARQSSGSYSTYGAYSLSLGGKGYAALGAAGATGGVFPPDIMEYDAVSDTWTELTEFSGEGRRYGSAFSIGNKGYFVGGLMAIQGVWKQEVWEFTPPSN